MNTTAPRSIDMTSAAFRVALIAAQGLLALAFAGAGVMKATVPIAELATKLPFVTAVPEALVRFIGLAEILAAVGLTLPPLTRVKPWLASWAALGLLAVMVFAALFHIVRGEAAALPINVILGGLAAFVAWGRRRLAQ